jgi:hypothetical protein
MIQTVLHVTNDAMPSIDRRSFNGFLLVDGLTTPDEIK